VKRLAIVPLVFLVVACARPRVYVVPSEHLAAVAARIGQVGDGDALVIAAGDIADCGEQLEAARSTAALVRLFPAATVIAPGDTAYPDGARQDFERCYEPTWGAFKARTRPAPGNHEYHTPDAAGYFEYFGVPPFYSFDLGSWHVVSLDSMRDMGEQSEQVAWLRRDLESSDKPCILAFWHHPRFSSGYHGRQRHDPGRQTGVLWRALAEHRAALIINGHDHHYERFARIDGIREIVAGTGGGELRPVPFPRRHSEAGDTRHYGVVVLTLHPASYEWHFLGIDGAVHDASSAPEPCR
jgi:3',5'-cyclic AMP phosphodiesterase CpdA